MTDVSGETKEKDIAFTTSQRDNRTISVMVNLDYEELELDKLHMTVEPPPGDDILEAPPQAQRWQTQEN